MITAIHKSLAAKREDIKNNEQGFTLIELLVVVLIIGVLAAIAIPVFLGQQAQAQNSAAESDLATAKVAYVSYLVENSAGVAAAVEAGGAVPAELVAFGFPSTVAIATPGGGGAFCLERLSESGATYSIDGSASGPVTPSTCE